jgi:hypothetical protein
MPTDLQRARINLRRAMQDPTDTGKHRIIEELARAVAREEIERAKIADMEADGPEIAATFGQPNPPAVAPERGKKRCRHLKAGETCHLHNLHCQAPDCFEEVPEPAPGRGNTDPGGVRAESPQQCICHHGFGMNLSCPVHAKPPAVARRLGIHLEDPS